MLVLRKMGPSVLHIAPIHPVSKLAALQFDHSL
jgi:hypothetical protein